MQEAQDVIRIPRVEEELVIDTQRVSDGVISVSTSTRHVAAHEDVVLDQDDVEIQRIPVGEFVASAPTVRTEGNVTIIPVLEERLVIEKRLFLVEEVHISRKTTSRTESVDAVLRKQTATIERQS